MRSIIAAVVLFDLGLIVFLAIKCTVPPTLNYAVSKLISFPCDSSWGIAIALIKWTNIWLTAQLFMHAMASTSVFVINEVFFSLLSFRTYLRQLFNENYTPKNFEKYRQLQILNQQFNHSYQFVFFVFALGIMQLTMMVFAYAVLKLHHEIQTPGVVSGTMVLIAALLIEYLILRLASTIRVESTTLVKAWRSHSTTSRRNSLFQRVAVSCPGLKIKIGHSNFVDKLLPIVMLEFFVQHTMSLLLLKI
jgi:hypothetical protein